MNYERRDVENARHRMNGTSVMDDQKVQHAHAIVQAALSVENVTGDPDWDRVLTMIQAVIETTKKDRAAHEAAVLDPHLTDPLEMQRAKLAALLAAERIRTLEAVIALPASLKKEGAVARDLLLRLQDVSN